MFCFLAHEHGAQGNVVQAQTYDTLQMQVWSLLSGFCTQPTDVKQSFKGIAKILGSALQDRADLRLDVMLSLRKLINANIENGKSGVQEIFVAAETNLNILLNSRLHTDFAITSITKKPSHVRLIFFPLDIL